MSMLFMICLGSRIGQLYILECDFPTNGVQHNGPYSKSRKSVFNVSYNFSLFVSHFLSFVRSLALNRYYGQNLNSLGNFIGTNSTIPEITFFVCCTLLSTNYIRLS